MLGLLETLKINVPYYFVADNCYANAAMIKGLIEQGNHLITWVKLNAVAYDAPFNTGRVGAGRPKTYGAKLHLKKIFEKESHVYCCDSTKAR